MSMERKFDRSSSNSLKKNKSTKNSNASSNNNVEKPKQPQRGLGVAQLEKIRLHAQMANCGLIPQHHFPPGFHSPFPAFAFQDDMRIQAAYHQALAMQSSSTPFGFAPPPLPLFSYHHPDTNIMTMAYGQQMERTAGNVTPIIAESHPAMISNRSNNANINVAAMNENHQYIQPQGMVTRHLLSHVEQNNKTENLLESKGSSNNQSIEPRIENEDLDLELKL